MNLETLVAGDTLDFNVSVPDYPPSDGWTLKYSLTPRFTSPTQALITLTAATDGNEYNVTAAPATTATWPAGFYTWARWVEKSGARQTLDESGQLEVKADPSATAQGHDSRTHAEIMLDAIESALEGKASASTLDMIAYTIGSRSKSLDRDVLFEKRTYYRIEVKREAAQNGKFDNKLAVRL